MDNATNKSYSVLVVGDAQRNFPTPEAAFDFARFAVSPGNLTRADAVRELAAGRPVRWTYGYNEVEITPSGAPTFAQMDYLRRITAQMVERDCADAAQFGVSL